MAKKFISIVLIVLLLTLAPLSVSAEATVQPRYSYTISHSSTLIIKDDIAYAESYLNGYSTATSINMTLTLQKKVLWWWDDVTSWTKSRPTNSITMSESTSVGGGTYRVKMVSVVCAGSTNSETVEGYSNEESN